MKLRPVQLVCLALLLATLRLADPAALASDSFALRVGVLNVLLRTELVETRTDAKIALTCSIAALQHGRASKTLPAAEVAALQNTWLMPPPALQSVGVQSVTSFFRG